MPDAAVTNRATGSNNTASTTHSVTTTAAAGELVIVCFTWDTATATATPSSGWTSLGTQAQGTTTNHSGAVFYKQNASANDTLTVTLSAAQRATWVVLRISNGGVPEATGTNGSAVTSVPLPTHTPSGGTANYLAIAFVGTDSSATTAQTITWPAGWTTNVQAINPTSTSSAASFTSDRQLTGVSSIAPGTATLGTSEQYIAFTVAVPGTASAPTSLVGYATATSITTTIVVNKSAINASLGKTLTDGDVLIAVQGAEWQTLTGLVASTGTWALAKSYDAGTNGSAGTRVKIWTRTASSEPASWTFGQDSGSDGVVTIIALRGLDLSQMVGDIVGTAINTSRVAPSISHAGTTGALLLAGAISAMNNSASSFTPPAGMTEIADAGSAFIRGTVAYLDAPANPTGTKTFTSTSSTQDGQGVQWALVLAPTVSAGGPVTPTIRSTSKGNGTATATSTQVSTAVTKPTGLAVGDYLLALHNGTADSSANGAPAGWTKISESTVSQANNVPLTTLWGKVADSTDVAASTFTFTSTPVASSTAGQAIIIMAITAGTYSSTTPVTVGTWTHVTRGTAGTGTTAQTAASMTGVASGLLLALFGVDANGNVQTYPSTAGSTALVDYTQSANGGPGGINYSLEAVYKLVLSAGGATGAVTVTPSGTNTSNGFATLEALVNPGAAADDGTSFFYELAA